MTRRVGRAGRSAGIALLLVLATPVAAQQGSLWNDSTARASVDARVLNGELMGVAAGFSVRGAVQWTHAAGDADHEQGVPFTPTTLTRIASIAKPMTAVAIMQQVEKGTIQLDADVRTYLPGYPARKEGPITVRQLLRHTSGMDDYRTDKERQNRIPYPTLADAMAIFQDRELLTAPGTSFHYTSYGYVVLGAVLEKVTGLPYAELMRVNIWEKAGMHHTGVERPDMPGSSHAALYHTNSKGRISRERPTDLSDRVPGGGLYSCLTDLLAFGDAVLDGTLISPASLAAMSEDPGVKRDGNGYGLGWYLYGDNPEHGPVIGHNGSQTGASTYLMLLPREGTTVAVVSNTSGALRAVTDITLGLFDQAHAAAAP